MCSASSARSSSAWSPGGTCRGTSPGEAARAGQRARARDPATTRPTRTATTRSTARVATAVSTSTTRRSGWRGATPAPSRPRPCAPRWPAAPQPARPAGSADQRRGGEDDDPARTRAWVSAASREPAPERTLTAVRAIAAVAGTPPNSGVARLATPWPNSSRSGSWRWPTLMPSATVADSSDSSAARAATAAAGATSARTGTGRGSRGRARAVPPGRSPIRAASSGRDLHERPWPPRRPAARTAPGAATGRRPASPRPRRRRSPAPSTAGGPRTRAPPATPRRAPCPLPERARRARRDLLQGDHRGDADGEALHHRGGM